ncbi:hypothetical protein BVRB_4g076090 [Beta vulgaris subsp. vulgaris]|uniref:Uncharacterized protein n=1 Tax=Beta vulgaris subsp. vulgaris TaxID=3555 RepID=A0A0J8CQF4_BETVV|nr:hypothetical protein BVRB_4g076090 [Beta vulgaris subsp. vulgaris]
MLQCYWMTFCTFISISNCHLLLQTCVRLIGRKTFPSILNFILFGLQSFHMFYAQPSEA